MIFWNFLLPPECNGANFSIAISMVCWSKTCREGRLRRSRHLHEWCQGGGALDWKNIFCCTLSSTWTRGLFLASQALVSPDEPHQDCLNPCLNPSPSVYLPVNIPVPGLIMHNWMVVKAREQDLPHFVIIVFPDLITRSMLEYMERRLYNTKINELGLLHHFRWPLYSNKIKTKNKTHKKRADVLAGLPESACWLMLPAWCRCWLIIRYFVLVVLQSQIDSRTKNKGLASQDCSCSLRRQTWLCAWWQKLMLDPQSLCFGLCLCTSILGHL